MVLKQSPEFFVSVLPDRRVQPSNFSIQGSAKNAPKGQLHLSRVVRKNASFYHSKTSAFWQIHSWDFTNKHAKTPLHISVQCFCWVNQPESYGKWLGGPPFFDPTNMCSWEILENPPYIISWVQSHHSPTGSLCGFHFQVNYLGTGSGKNMDDDSFPHCEPRFWQDQTHKSKLSWIQITCVWIKFKEAFVNDGGSYLLLVGGWATQLENMCKIKLSNHFPKYTGYRNVNKLETTSLLQLDDSNIWFQV